MGNERKEIGNMDSQEKLKSRNTFEAMVRRLQFALDAYAELKRHEKTMEQGHFALKMKQAELCVKSARKALESARIDFESVCR